MEKDNDKNRISSAVGNRVEFDGTEESQLECLRCVVDVERETIRITISENLMR